MKKIVSVLVLLLMACSGEDGVSDNSQLLDQITSNVSSGSWIISYYYDTNSGDDSLDDLHFNISFASPPYFAELTDDWDIVAQSDSTIELIDVSDGNGGTDYLTFQKQ